MEIRGKKKITFDRINEPVRKWGLSSLSLVAFVFVLILVTAILLFINIVIAILFMILYVYSILKYSKWLIENQKKGLDNPLTDKLEYLSISKYYEQSLNHKSIYEKKK